MNAPRSSDEPPNRDRRVHELLTKALGAPAAQRRGVLEAAEPDSELVEEVLSLLAEVDDGFLEEFSWNRLGTGFAPTEPGRRSRRPEEDPSEAPAYPPHPERVGPYRILRHLASGGMGEVFLAEQSEPVHRRLAVKLIRTTLARGPGEARFRAEQQAMARLAHPNVAKLFDAGTSEQGFPYFAMEYVDGAPLTTFADERRLSVAERIGLLIDVCRGVEHAHRRGILHRDLKPGNVLVEDVEGRPTPRIIDFGIAKAIEDPLIDGTLTRERQPLGTPAYMSPEALAAEPDLDTRTDVYSIGVLLFELLVGSRPSVDEGTARERWRSFLEAGQPPRASTQFLNLSMEEQQERARERGITRHQLVAMLAGDLGWIAWTALAPNRDERYGSVSALAEDLEAWLDRRPIRARPPSLGYRVRKLVERHRGVALMAVLVVFATVSGLVGTTVGFVRARAEAERANQEAERANQEARTARTVVDFLVELFEVADPYESRGETVTARELLDQGADRIRTELAGEPVTQARLMEVMGRVYVSLGLLDPAEELVRAALANVGDVQGAELETAAILDELGYVLYKRNANDEATRILERALSLRRSLLGTDHELTAKTLLRLGDVEEQRGRYEEAERHLAEALRIQETVLGPDDLEVAETLSRRAVVAVRRGELDEALRLAERVLEIREAAFGSMHLEVADALVVLGTVHFYAERLEAAAATSRRCLAIREEILGPDHPEVAQSLLNLAVSSDEFDVAVPLLERALAIWEKALGPDHPRIAQTVGNLAYYFRQERRLEEAEPLLERAYRISLQPDQDPRRRVDYLGTLAKIDVDLGRMERAEERLRTALRHAEEGSVPDDDRDTLEALQTLAELLRETGRAEEAEVYVERWEAATGETYAR